MPFLIGFLSLVDPSDIAPLQIIGTVWTLLVPLFHYPLVVEPVKDWCISCTCLFTKNITFAHGPDGISENIIPCQGPWNL
jgi:hypothetical protein